MAVPDIVDAAWSGALAVALAIGALFIWNLACAPYRNQRDAAAQERVRAEKAERALAAASPHLLPGPDMTIRELFLHLDPQALEAPRWLAIGQVVKDNFAVGRLDCWGRPKKRWDDVEEMFGWPEQSALEKIDNSYWKRAELSYAFVCSEDRYYLPHTNPDMHSGLPTYKDLQVNRAQAIALNWSEIDRIRAIHAKMSPSPLDATTQITDLPRRTTGDPEQRVRAAAPTQADRFSPQSGKAPEITTPAQR